MNVRGTDVLMMLRPEGGWIISGDEYESIQFLECEPITKEAFQAGFAAVDQHKKEKETLASIAKQAAEAKLAALGLTADDLRALGL
jgi:hypothetical protein